MMQRRSVFRLLIAIAFAVAPNLAAALDLVHFPSAAAPKGGQQEALTNSPETKPGYPIWGHLGKPHGAGPFPAIVLMHGCGGVQQSHMRWASLLNDAGYVTLVLDSFRPRHIIRLCEGGNSAASESGRVLDAIGALDYLQELPFVIPDKVAVIGWSHGAGTALNAVSKFGIGDKFPSAFKAAVAVYPYCNSNRSFNVPTLVLIGEADDWTPADLCRDLQNRNDDPESAFELVVYDGAFHAFDDADIGTGFLFRAFRQPGIGCNMTRRPITIRSAESRRSLPNISPTSLASLPKPLTCQNFPGWL
jgi:dienelactone hydrolase